MKVTQNHIRQIKRHLSANGSILLPLALKWRLFYAAIGMFAVLISPGMASHRVSAAAITLSVPQKLSLVLNQTGVFESTNSGNISVASDAYAGYTLKIRSTDGNNALTGSSGIIKSIVTAAAGSAFEANTWGYQFRNLTAQATTNFEPGPTTDKVVATTAAASAEDKYVVTLGAKVDGNTPAGTYSHSFVLTVTANDVPYTVKYNGESAPATASGVGSENSTVILADALKREGYGFIGWCNQPTTNETCTGRVWQPGEPYSLANQNNALNLYGMWTEVTSEMQNWKGCSALQVNQTVRLVDLRDNNAYRVRKLKDGLCWMIENLRISGPKNLSKETTDLNDRDTFFLNSSIDVFFVGTAPQMNARSVSNFVSGTTERIGAYYNWFTATAASGTYGAELHEAPSSICPKGWRLPTGAESGEFLKLANLYGYDDGKASVAAAASLKDSNGPNFILSGFYGTTSAGGQNVAGYYWASTADGDGARYLAIFSSSVTPLYVDYGNEEYHGHTVRCVSR